MGRTEEYKAAINRTMTVPPQVYVLGFAFSPAGRVVLIRKERPDWQKGFLNGVGGKVEPKELPAAAMEREFREETGVDVRGWVERGAMIGRDWVVYVYTVQLTAEQIRSVRSETDEMVQKHELPLMGVKAIENLPALIELCKMAAGSSGVIPYFQLHY